MHARLSAERQAEIYRIMKNSEIFGPLNPRSLARAAERMRQAEYGENEVIFREGDPGNRM